MMVQMDEKFTSLIRKFHKFMKHSAYISAGTSEVENRCGRIINQCGFQKTHPITCPSFHLQNTSNREFISSPNYNKNWSFDEKLTVRRFPYLYRVQRRKGAWIVNIRLSDSIGNTTCKGLTLRPERDLHNENMFSSWSWIIEKSSS